MTPFILAAIALVAVTLALLTRPWWPGARKVGGADIDALNTAIYRDQHAELERDLKLGLLSPEDHATALAELRRRVLEDTNLGHSPALTHSGRGTLIALLVFVPLLGGMLYVALGNPQASLSAEARTAAAMANVDKMLAALAADVARQPDNLQARFELARAYKMIGRHEDAARTLAVIAPQMEGNAPMLAEYAEILILKDGFTRDTRALLTRALKADANNTLALVLAGTDAFQDKRWADAIKHWERLYKLLDPESEEGQIIEASLARAREELATQRGGKVSKAGSISGRVDIAPALKSQVSPNDVVFVFARAVNGPRMPLAAKKARVSDLPLQFDLSDADALPNGQKLSSASSVTIEARVARGGSATASKGDLSGSSAPVKPGTKGVNITLDKVLD